MDFYPLFASFCARYRSMESHRLRFSLLYFVTLMFRLIQMDTTDRSSLSKYFIRRIRICVSVSPAFSV